MGETLGGICARVIASRTFLAVGIAVGGDRLRSPALFISEVLREEHNALAPQEV